MAAHWPVEALNAYVDVERAQRALAGDPAESPEFAMLCQLMGLGLWLAGRDCMARSE